MITETNSAKPTWQVEVARCWTDHTWDTDLVEIPLETPEDQIESAAVAVCVAARAENPSQPSMAFASLYHWSEEDRTAARNELNDGEPVRPNGLLMRTLLTSELHNAYEYQADRFSVTLATVAGSLAQGTLADLVPGWTDTIDDIVWDDDTEKNYETVTRELSDNFNEEFELLCAYWGLDGELEEILKDGS